MRLTRSTITVHYWRFSDGSDNGLMATMARGWYCWVYPQDDLEFVTWMTKNCPGAKVTHRFNNGNPMHTVYIPDDREATVFQLKWL